MTGRQRGHSSLMDAALTSCSPTSAWRNPPTLVRARRRCIRLVPAPEPPSVLRFSGTRQQDSRNRTSKHGPVTPEAPFRRRSQVGRGPGQAATAHFGVGEAHVEQARLKCALLALPAPLAPC